MAKDGSLLHFCATNPGAPISRSRANNFETPRTVVTKNETTTSISQLNTRPKLEAVYDSGNKKIRGLWRRGSRFYAQLRVDVGNGQNAPRWIPLSDALDLRSARAELERKRTERRDNRLTRHGRGACPTFEAFAARYFASPDFTQKKLRTQESQRQAIKRWLEYLGGFRLDKISLALIDDYRQRRLKEGVAPRTVNLDVIALRQVLSAAKMRGHLDNIIQFFAPRSGGGLRALRQPPAPKRPLLSHDNFQALLNSATEAVTKNAAQLRFYLRFLALTGAREKEGLAVARADVNFDRRFVTIGAGGDTKNDRSRSIDFSSELEELLKELAASLPPDTSWLFPSPQRGCEDIHAKTLRESFKLVRKKAALEWVGFHDLRHFFASQCVMTGIDFMTISEWLGHSDGGILVGRVYGHLAATHKQEAARKLRFFA